MPAAPDATAERIREVVGDLLPDPDAPRAETSEPDASTAGAAQAGDQQEPAETATGSDPYAFERTPTARPDWASGARLQDDSAPGDSAPVDSADAPDTGSSSTNAPTPGTGAARTDQVVTLPRGSTVLLYTDGLVERRDQLFDAGIERLRTELAALRDVPVAELADRLLARVLPDRAEDDVALIAVRLHPPHPAG